MLRETTRVMNKQKSQQDIDTSETDKNEGILGQASAGHPDAAPTQPGYSQNFESNLTLPQHAVSHAASQGLVISPREYQ
jgi:hypothetical protein